MARRERYAGVTNSDATKSRSTALQTSYLFQSAMHYHRAGMLEKAEEAYSKVLAIDPKHAESLHFLALIAHQTGRNKLALALIRKALAVGNQIAEYHYSAGEVCRAIARSVEALAHYRRSIELKPD